MFKKSGIMLVVLLYLVTANGFALNLHFCGNIIVSVKIDAPTKRCGMDSKCCKEKHLEIKVKDAHQAAHTVFTDAFLAVPVPVFSFGSFNEPTAVNQLSNLFLERGPPPNAVPVFIRNCTFRI